LVRKDNTPDENHRIALLRIDAIQELRLLSSIEHIASNTRNPTFTIWGNRQLLVTQSPRTAAGIFLNWGNVSGFDPNFERLASLPKRMIDGLDQRVEIINENAVVILYSQSSMKRKRYIMWMGNLNIDPQTKNMTFTSRELIYHNDNTYWLHRKVEHEKNWIPFMYNNTRLYMIQRLNPLRV
jgi:hypothetical protein